MSKNTRAGKKYSNNHTTLIPLAAEVCDLITKCPSVQKIAPGFIKAGLKSLGGKKRVKISKTQKAIRLQFRDNTTQQEVFVYADDFDEVINTIKKEQEERKTTYVVKIVD